MTAEWHHVDTSLTSGFNKPGLVMETRRIDEATGWLVEKIFDLFPYDNPRHDGTIVIARRMAHLLIENRNLQALLAESYSHRQATE